jgi:hypothetical protein
VKSEMTVETAIVVSQCVACEEIMRLDDVTNDRFYLYAGSLNDGIGEGKMSGTYIATLVTRVQGHTLIHCVPLYFAPNSKIYPYCSDIHAGSGVAMSACINV